MEKYTSTRAVYFLIASVLLISLLLNNWYLVAFVILMLSMGVVSKFCPSKWIFERLGFRKSEL